MHHQLLPNRRQVTLCEHQTQARKPTEKEKPDLGRQITRENEKLREVFKPDLGRQITHENENLERYST
eukprot:UN18563